MHSDNVTRADNQQGSPLSFIGYDPSETTRRTPQIIQAYFLGALHDATFSSNKRFRFSQKGTEWLQLLRILLKRIGYNSWIYREGKDRDVYVLETLAPFLTFHRDPLTLPTLEERTAYVRGFFDAEGGMPHDPEARFYIQLVQKDAEKLFKIKQILKEHGIDCGTIHNPSKRVDPDYWRMYVLAKSWNTFVQQVGSWHPRKRNLLQMRMMI